jgi:hypothetical protein
MRPTSPLRQYLSLRHISQALDVPERHITLWEIMGIIPCDAVVVLPTGRPRYDIRRVLQSFQDNPIAPRSTSSPD